MSIYWGKLSFLDSKVNKAFTKNSSIEISIYLLFLDMSVTKFTDLVSSGAGGILLLLPSIDSMQKLSEENRESINLLQDHLHTTEFEIPIYFAEESPELLELMESLGGDTGGEKKASAFESKYFD